MPTRDELANALRKADAAGATDDAKRLADAIRAMDGQSAQPTNAPGAVAPLGNATGEWDLSKFRALPPQPVAQPQQPYQPPAGVPFDPLAKNGVSTGRSLAADDPFSPAFQAPAPEAPKPWNQQAADFISQNVTPFGEALAGQRDNNEILKTVTGGLPEWTATAFRDPNQAQQEAGQFIRDVEPTNQIAGGYNDMQNALGSLFKGDTTEAFNKYKEATPKLLFGAAGMLPGGSFAGDAARAGARPGVRAALRPGDVRLPSATSIDAMPMAPEPQVAPPAQMFTGPPGPAPRKGSPILRNADRIAGGAVGATIGGGGGEAFAAADDGSDQGGIPGQGAMIGGAAGMFAPRAIVNAANRGRRGVGRMMAGGAAASYDERVAAKAVRDALRSSGIKTADQAAAEMAARYGDKPAAIADLAQEGVGTAAGLSRLPGKTGEAAKARNADLLENRSGRLFTDIESTTGIDPANVTKTIDDAIRQASEEISPAYEGMFTANRGVNSERLMQLMGDPVVGPYLRRAVQASESLATTAGQAPSNARTWDLVKRGLDRTIEGQIRTSGQAAPELMAARQAVRDELDALIPEYKGIRDNADAPRMRAARQKGAEAMGGRLSVEKVKAIASSLTGRPLTTMQAGMIEQLVPGIEKAKGAGNLPGVAALTSARTEQALAAAFGPDTARNLIARIRADAALTQNAGRINPNVGSVTSQAAMGGGGVGNLLAGAVRAVRNPTEAGLAWLSKSGAYSKQQRDIMGEMLLEGATPENLQRIFRGRGGPPRNALAGPPRPPGGGSSVAAGGVAGAAAGLTGTASADTGDTQAELGRSQAQFEQATQTLAQLQSELEIFDNGSIEDIQRLLNLKGQPTNVDGRLGPETAGNIQKFRAETLARIKDAQALVSSAQEAVKASQQKLDYESTRPPGWVTPLQEAAPWVAMGAGMGIGKWSRGGAVKAAEKKAIQQSAKANALLNAKPVLPPTGPAAERALHKRYANINEFWRQGGAGEQVPFKTLNSGEWRGQKAASPSSLYPGGPSRMRPADAVVMGSALGEAAITQFGALPVAMKELEDAQKAVDANPTKENYTRLENAKTMVAAANAIARAGLGVAIGRGAGVISKPYTSARPNIGAAETERAMLLDYAKKQPGGGGPPAPPRNPLSGPPSGKTKTTPPSNVLTIATKPPKNTGGPPVAANDTLPKGQQTPAQDLAMARAFNSEPLTAERAYDFWTLLKDETDPRKIMDVLDMNLDPSILRVARGKAMVERAREEVLRRATSLMRKETERNKSNTLSRANAKMAENNRSIANEIAQLRDRGVPDQMIARSLGLEDGSLEYFLKWKKPTSAQGGALDLTPDGWEKSAQVGNAKLTYAVQPDGTMSLEMIDVPAASRGQGEAGRALDKLLAEADAKGLTVYLEPKPVGSGGMTRQQLEAFYRKRGFTQQAGTPGLTRSPNGPQGSEDWYHASKTPLGSFDPTKGQLGLHIGSRGAAEHMASGTQSRPYNPKMDWPVYSVEARGNYAKVPDLGNWDWSSYELARNGTFAKRGASELEFDPRFDDMWKVLDEFAATRPTTREWHARVQQEVAKRKLAGFEYTNRAEAAGSTSRIVMDPNAVSPKGKAPHK